MNLADEMVADAQAALPSDEQVKQIAEIANLEIESARKVDDLEAQLKEEKERLRRIRESDLPAAMAEAGVSLIGLPTGQRVEVKEVIAARIPTKFKANAFDWLRENGHGDLIKNEIKVSLGKGDEEVANAVAAYLEEIHLPYKKDSSVHYQTLGGFVREQLSEGNEIPEDWFGIYRAQVASVK